MVDDTCHGKMRVGTRLFWRIASNPPKSERPSFVADEPVEACASSSKTCSDLRRMSVPCRDHGECNPREGVRADEHDLVAAG